jgi:hypothetical protein
LMLQVLAAAASVAVVDGTLLWTGKNSATDLTVGFFLGFLASYLSPVFNDIIKGLQSLRS